MCTLALSLRPSPGVLLAASGNRNEFLARPSAGPRVWPELDGVLMPRDEKAGGTWLGLTARGLFVCVTNRRGPAADPDRASRGLLTVDALRSADAVELRFHLVFADAREAGVAICDGERLEMRALAPGQAHVVTERSYGAGEGPREAAVLREVAPLLLRPNVTAAALRPPMQRHASEPLESACVHAEAFGYGTRSSMQLVLRPDRAEMLFTEGHPCTEPASDLSPVASSLIGGAVVQGESGSRA
jgi:Transport and Golgi organisation 2